MSRSPPPRLEALRECQVQPRVSHCLATTLHSATGMLLRDERIDLSGSSIHVANVRLGGCKGLVAGGVGEQVAWATP